VGSLDRRLKRLEDSALASFAGAATPEEMEERGWPIDDQIDAVLAHLRVHMWGRSVQVATDRELYIVEELIAAEVLPPSARGYFRRMDPAEQPEREEWLFSHREPSKADYGEEGHGA
jgi:hypothetical protein